MADLILKNRIWWRTFVALMAVAMALAALSALANSYSENAWGTSLLVAAFIFLTFSLYGGIWIRPLGIELKSDSVILRFIGRRREIPVNSIVALPSELDPSRDSYIRIEDWRTLPVRSEVCQAMLERYPFLTLRTEAKRRVSLW